MIFISLTYTKKTGYIKQNCSQKNSNKQVIIKCNLYFLKNGQFFIQLQRPI